MSEQPVKKTSSGLQENVAGLLCYLVGWITGIIFLVIEKDNKTVRFHAWQSIFVSGAYTILWIVFGWIPIIGWIIMGIMGVIFFILWIVLMYKAYKGEMFKLPVVGNLAEKYAKATPAQSTEEKKDQPK
jgi:uncharacterized membrane protein